MFAVEQCPVACKQVSEFRRRAKPQPGQIESFFSCLMLTAWLRNAQICPSRSLFFGVCKLSEGRLRRERKNDFRFLGQVKEIKIEKQIESIIVRAYYDIPIASSRLDLFKLSLAGEKASTASSPFSFNDFVQLDDLTVTIAHAISISHEDL